MSESERNEVIDRFFDALDADEFDRLRDVFTEDATFAAGDDPLSGIEEIITHYEENRTASNTDHRITRRVHDGDTACVEGSVTGDLPGEEDLEGDYLDVMEFDPDSDRISYIKGYTHGF